MRFPGRTHRAQSSALACFAVSANSSRIRRLASAQFTSSILLAIYLRSVRFSVPVCVFIFSLLHAYSASGIVAKKWIVLAVQKSGSERGNELANDRGSDLAIFTSFTFSVWRFICGVNQNIGLRAGLSSVWRRIDNGTLSRSVWASVSAGRILFVHTFSDLFSGSVRRSRCAVDENDLFDSKRSKGFEKGSCALK